ncbi:AAA family ATPase [Actinomyces gaoshouyii]|uniref:Pilus biosynthesis protein CpaE n=1 Tax=Actinomyces gaoshouyii TaxID=1960083 RepID=A0A8H9LEE7_9ACTO|nr:hypothetical protein [Actinomyces gaoshouyii]GGO96244.1 pilus biosynthesis protein CpaE [Actinomyces gaoshouyii]
MAAPASGVLLGLAGSDAETLRAIDDQGSGLRVVRRCADLTDLVGAAMAGLASLVVLETAFDDVDRAIIDRITRCGAVGVLLVPDGEEAQWSMPGWIVLSAAARPAEVRGALQALARRAVPPPPAGGWGTAAMTTGSAPQGARATIGSAPVPGEPMARSEEAVEAAPPPPGAPAAGRRGRIVAVWGPHGAPGRSTIAASLAHGLAPSGGALLVDADIEAPSLVELLGVPEDSSSLATAARLAAHGRLDDAELARLVVPIGAGVGLLSGLGRPGRWRELPPVAMEAVWGRARRAAAWTVVDLAGGPIDDAVDEYSLEPGRGAMASELLRQADEVLLVGAGDPIGVRRLLQLLTDCEEAPGAGRAPRVVVNRVRASAAGPSPARAVRESLGRFGGVADPILLPEDPQAADRCVLEARAVLDLCPGSALGRALAGLVDALDPSAGCSRPARSRSRRGNTRAAGDGRHGRRRAH